MSSPSGFPVTVAAAQASLTRLHAMNPDSTYLQDLVAGGVDGDVTLYRVDENGTTPVDPFPRAAHFDNNEVTEQSPDIPLFTNGAGDDHDSDFENFGNFEQDSAFLDTVSSPTAYATGMGNPLDAGLGNDHITPRESIESSLPGYSDFTSWTSNGSDSVPTDYGTPMRDANAWMYDASSFMTPEMERTPSNDTYSNITPPSIASSPTGIVTNIPLDDTFFSMDDFVVDHHDVFDSIAIDAPAAAASSSTTGNIVDSATVDATPTISSPVTSHVGMQSSSPFAIEGTFRGRKARSMSPTRSTTTIVSSRKRSSSVMAMLTPVVETPAQIKRDAFVDGTYTLATPQDLPRHSPFVRSQQALLRRNPAAQQSPTPVRAASGQLQAAMTNNSASKRKRGSGVGRKANRSATSSASASASTPDGGSTPRSGKPRITASGRVAAKPRPISTNLDEFDATMVRMKKAGRGNTEIAETLREMGLDLDPKTVGTRFNRIMEVMRVSEGGSPVWGPDDDEVLLRTHERMLLQTTASIDRAYTRHWAAVADNMQDRLKVRWGKEYLQGRVEELERERGLPVGRPERSTLPDGNIEAEVKRRVAAELQRRDDLEKERVELEKAAAAEAAELARLEEEQRAQMKAARERVVEAQRRAREALRAVEQVGRGKKRERGEEEEDRGSKRVRRG